MTVVSEDYRDFIVSELQRADFEKRFPKSSWVQPMGTFFSTYYVESALADPINFNAYPYNSIPKCFTLLDMEAMNQAGILQVQNYPNLELQGTGVLVGFIDTGIDYTNSIFRNLDGSTRIMSIWDQTIQDGNPPEGFIYGTEYTEIQINEALRSDNPYNLVLSRDDNSHGTFVASLAAGSANEGNQFIGAAPDAALAVVKLKPAKQYLKDFYLIGTNAPCYQENDIMAGVVYLNQLAKQLEMPLIICIALGTSQGSHSGSSPLANILDIYGNISETAVVIGGGNEANERHHFLGRLNMESEMVETEIRVADGVNGFVLELWSEPFNLVSVAIESPSGERTYTFPIRGNQLNTYTFVLEQTEVMVNYKVFAERLDAELVFVRIKKPTEGIWKLIVKPVSVTEGQFHIWLPIREFMEEDVFFLESNADFTITEPGSALSGMTVGFYDGSNNSIAIDSGRGYTRSMRIKPDFVAPGVNVRGLAARGLFVTRTGSSIAAGITAGAAALIMEWVVYRLGQRGVVSTQIRDLLILGTEKRFQETYPNREWGYGRLNVYNTFETLRRI